MGPQDTCVVKMEHLVTRPRVRGELAPSPAYYADFFFFRVGGPAPGGARRRWRLSAGGRGGAAARLRAASP